MDDEDEESRPSAADDSGGNDESVSTDAGDENSKDDGSVSTSGEENNIATSLEIKRRTVLEEAEWQFGKASYSEVAISSKGAHRIAYRDSGCMYVLGRDAGDNSFLTEPALISSFLSKLSFNELNSVNAEVSVVWSTLNLEISFYNSILIFSRSHTARRMEKLCFTLL